MTKILLKKKVLLIGVFSILLVLIACMPVQEEHEIIQNVEEQQIISPKIELTNLIDKSITFQNVILSFTETTNINSTLTQIKNTNVSYTNDSIKIINNVRITELNNDITYTLINDWGYELVKEGVYTQCVLDVDIWVCEETTLNSDETNAIFAEIKDKNFINNLGDVEKLNNNCYVINKQLIDCYDSDGFLTNMTFNNIFVVRNYISFDKDSFVLPDNRDYIN